MPEESVSEEIRATEEGFMIMVLDPTKGLQRSFYFISVPTTVGWWSRVKESENSRCFLLRHVWLPGLVHFKSTPRAFSSTYVMK